MKPICILVCLSLGCSHIVSAKGGFKPFEGRFPTDGRNLNVDSAGNRWLLDQGKVFVYILDELQASHSFAFDHKPTQVVTDTRGNAWILTTKSLYVVTYSTGKTKLLEGRTPICLSRAPDGRAMFYDGEKLQAISMEKNGDWNIEALGVVEGAQRFSVDTQGNIFAKTKSGVFRMEARENAWQRNWMEVGNLPGSNHDLSGDILDGKFYMAGGLTAEWGWPAQRKTYETLLCFDPQTTNWKSVGKLMHPRRYNATSHLDGEIWIIAGDQGQGHPPLNTVEILNLPNGEVRKGPPLPAPISICTAHNVSGRLYVLGQDKNSQTKGNFFSIGKVEQEWLEELAVPELTGPIVSTSDSDKIYVVIPHKHLAIYHTTLREWKSVSIPTPPRSCQIAMHKAEVWLMGGRGVPGGKITQIYNPATNQWRYGPDLPRELVWGTSFSINGELFLAGGAAGTCYSNRTFRLK